MIPSTAAERKGIQPVVHLTANGGVRSEISTNKPVKFAAAIEVPPGTGKIISAEWDFDGDGRFAIAENVKEPKPQVSVRISHSYTKPGTYFVTFRAISQRDGDAETPFARIQNLARVRVVVR